MVQRPNASFSLSLALAALTFACTSADPDAAGFTGGTGGTGAPSAGHSGGGQAGGGTNGGMGAQTTSGRGGGSGSGGAAAASAAGGGGGSTAGSAGSAGSPIGSGGAGRGAGGAGAGATSTGGAGGRAASGGAAGTGDTAGAGAVAGSGGGGAGGSSTAVPSAGCGKGGKPSNVTTSDHIYTFPASYDGTTPIPLFMGFHAAGNPIDQIKKLTDSSALDMNYVRAFGKSSGNEWVYNTDINKVYGWYDDLMATYCIDKSRVFAAGHSSGAQMIVQILTKADATMHMGFKAVAPVAASNYGAITAPIPVMYIQGKMDNVRNSNGSDVVARFTAVNGCGTTTMPYSSVAMCMSNGTNVTPGCVSYDGCMEPTIWCSHNDPEYSNTNHGWPCFATKAMSDFFAALP